MPFPFDVLPGGEAPDKLRISSSATGPSDRRRAAEDGAAAFANTLSFQACVEAGVGGSMLERWFRGIILEFRATSPVVVL